MLIAHVLLNVITRLLLDWSMVAPKSDRQTAQRDRPIVRNYSANSEYHCIRYSPTVGQHIMKLTSWSIDKMI